jgi:hypothetical protein
VLLRLHLGNLRSVDLLVLHVDALNISVVEILLMVCLSQSYLGLDLRARQAEGSDALKLDGRCPLDLLWQALLFLGLETLLC